MESVVVVDLVPGSWGRDRKRGIERMGGWLGIEGFHEWRSDFVGELREVEGEDEK